MVTATDVFLFVPNLIGYARIILAVVACFYMSSNYVIASWCYVISALLDAVDGHAARYLGQASKFGAMLDQLTDRCATMCLLVVLAIFYPAYTVWFQISMAIDIASHWMHLQSAAMMGKTSHKAIDLSENKILNFYYTSRPFLFFMCAGNESFYSFLYLCHFTYGPVVPVISVGLFPLICVLSAPVCFVKTAISVIHLIAASYNIASLDVSDRNKK